VGGLDKHAKAVCDNVFSMRELHGVGFATCDLKLGLLFFDKLHLLRPSRTSNGQSDTHGARRAADLEFLHSRDLVEYLPRQIEIEIDGLIDLSLLGTREDVDRFIGTLTRYMTSTVSSTKYDVVSVVGVNLPVKLPSVHSIQLVSSMQTTINVAMEAFPVFGETTSLEDIVAFRSELKDKQWNFRRFLQTLATKNQTEAEIRDDIQWCLHEYTEAMKKRKMKIIQSAVGAFVIPTADLMFNFPGNHIVSIAGAAVAVNRLRVELLDGEMKAPGRECAYVFDARKRFGR